MAKLYYKCYHLWAFFKAQEYFYVHRKILEGEKKKKPEQCFFLGKGVFSIFSYTTCWFFSATFLHYYLN